MIKSNENKGTSADSISGAGSINKVAEFENDNIDDSDRVLAALRNSTLGVAPDGRVNSGTIQPTSVTGTAIPNSDSHTEETAGAWINSYNGSSDNFPTEVIPPEVTDNNDSSFIISPDLSNEPINTPTQKSGRVVVITGASHGIGLAAANYFKKRGDTVVDLSRSSGTDVTDSDAVRAFFAKINTDYGRIDVLINNAGFGISGSAENTSADDVTKLFAVNFVGVSNCCSAVLPYMRKLGRSKIINISSVAAVFPLHFQSFYSASKAAVTSYSNALRREVAPFGISVCSVMPGDVATDFTTARKKNENDDVIYKSRVERTIAKYERDEHNGASPDSIAEKLYKISLKKNPKPFIVLGFKYKLFVFLTRLFPVRFVNWVLDKIY